MHGCGTLHRLHQYVRVQFLAPRLCVLRGKVMSTSQYSVLFSLLGIEFGGNGVNTFALPDLRGRVPINMGEGPGLPLYAIATRGGSPSSTISPTQMPRHTHGFSSTGSGLNAIKVKATAQIPLGV
ncbi:phage tail protein [Sphingomonas faeni]|uniref:phage tail protein n=1 Tax=Sphingomonas faeni TaxID=185950 RepID=UPI003364C32F